MSWGKKEKNAPDSQENPEEMKAVPEGGDFELEGEEAGTANLADKLKKLRAELEKCKEEKQEYLIGWQRCKADAINARRDAVLAAERAGNRSRDTLIEDIIPALDSFDMAIMSDAWANMDLNWRVGMENVRLQLISALANQGVTGFSEVGDMFEPALHEIVQQVEGDGEPGTIARILRRGYRSAEKIIRPAQVAVIAHKE